jgi:hypothetical protein
MGIEPTTFQSGVIAPANHASPEALPLSYLSHNAAGGEFRRLWATISRTPPNESAVH